MATIGNWHFPKLDALQALAYTPWGSVLALDDPYSLAKAHFERNRITRDDWQIFASHRTRVTELLIGAAGSDRPTLCVLGAGNGNDIDLSMLAERYQSITLVDLDPEALDHCVAKLPVHVAAQVETLAGVDLSGILSYLDLAPEQPLPSPQIEAAATRARDQPPPAGLVQYDVVASTCLLTQMIDSVVARLGSDHPQFAPLVLALRDGHLKLISDLTARPGTGLLITDFVSSDTLPQLQTVPDEQLEALLAGAINSGNFFTGVNPAVLAQRFAEESICGGGARVQLYPPWRWQMGNRCYGVCALAMARDC